MGELNYYALHGIFHMGDPNRYVVRERKGERLPMGMMNLEVVIVSHNVPLEDIKGGQAEFDEFKDALDYMEQKRHGDAKRINDEAEAKWMRGLLDDE